MSYIKYPDTYSVTPREIRSFLKFILKNLKLFFNDCKIIFKFISVFLAIKPKLYNFSLNLKRLNTTLFLIMTLACLLLI